MSITELRIVETDGGALARVVAVALRMQQNDEIDRWEFADDVKDAVVTMAGGEENRFLPQGHVNTGLYAAIDAIRDEIREAGAPDVASRKTVAGAYHTALAWPPEERVEGANYWAHYELKANEYHGRRSAILKKLVSRSSDGRVGTKDVRLWKSDSRPTDLTPRDQRLEKRLRTALHSWASPQSFAQLHEDERKAAAKILYRIAREIETGEFA